MFGMKNFIKVLFRKIADRLFLRKFDDIKIQKGQLFERHLDINLKDIQKLDQSYFKVFSQDTEDGIIQFLIKSLKLESIKFVEIGTQDYSESNTRYLYETMRCEGLIIDPYPNLRKKINSFLRIWKNKLHIHNDYANSENINGILKRYSFNKDIDVFSLDIDGIDYWVLKSIPDKISKIFILEYNPYFGPNKEVCSPNIEKFDRLSYHKSGFCWGASIKALIKLMDKKGYVFIGTNRLNVNAFFVLKELVNNVKIEIPDNNNLKKFTDFKFNVQFSDDISDLKVFDLKNNKLTNYLDIKE
jgi:hypothetical protein